jgi:hypothetical protein
MDPMGGYRALEPPPAGFPGEADACCKETSALAPQGPDPPIPHQKLPLVTGQQAIQLPRAGFGRRVGFAAPASLCLPRYSTENRGLHRRWMPLRIFPSQASL